MIANVAVFVPAGTVTDAGTLAFDGAELDKVICRPPTGAKSLIVTVPVAFWTPPITEVGLTVKAVSVNGLTRSAWSRVVP